MPSKCVLILLDGLGDRSFARFGHRTPLQAAHTPCLDSLAALGTNGLFHASRLGEALPSELAHFALFGYEREDFPGRGVLEALGTDIDLGPNDVAVLGHFIHADNEGGQLRVVRDKASASDKEIRAANKAVAAFEADGVRITYHPGKGTFGVLLMQGQVAPYFTDSNPMTDGRFLSEIVPLDSHRDDPKSIRAASALKKYLVHVWNTLDDNKTINMMVTQRAGQRKNVPMFSRKLGMRGASVASGVMYKGIARYLGLTPVTVTDGDDPGRDIAERIARATELLRDFDFIHVHTKTPDQAAHTKRPEAKKAVIESLDKGIEASIRPLLDDPDVLVAVTADHSTPSCGSLIHSGEPVPLLFVGKGVRRDKVKTFDEISAAAGCLGCVRGTEFMNLVLNHTDRIRLGGIWDSPGEQAFWPGDFEPFTLPGKD
ncbi:alkaline phosphatase family protein [Salidesulfovibrio onnuriiensis]|uniref:alkaline phosphatase family protein n=1 Tax=Salidesulfovibrio onnuriiensis TaxID=2583823 RepID=UPI0011C9CEC4|nr:alkaline phosphatase family protein [Salidesulfovibrio onnuriiensis]